MVSNQETHPEDDLIKVSVSMVTFNSSLELLEKTLYGLERALNYTRAAGFPINLHLLVVDNSTSAGYREQVRELLLSTAQQKFNQVDIWHPDGNVGYGAAHNQALARVDSDYHMILNPDVEMAQDALYRGLEFLEQQADVAMVSPRATNASGQIQYLCKRYPSVLVLSLRGFAPEFLKQRFQSYLYAYEIRDYCSDADVADVPLVSGCCMFGRTAALQRVAGFSDRYFMYFEDFDLSLRLHPIGRLVYLPTMHIVHHGGYSARKGLRHISMFVQSGWKFFSRHGWCWI